MSRKLAYIARITDIQPIKDADRIEVATINGGWQVVIKRGLHAVNEQVVYFEIDSVIPADKNWIEFLRDTKNPEKPIRLRTRRFKKQISQGLVMPLSILSEYTTEIVFADDCDLTELLSVKLYDDIKEEERGFVSKSAKPLNPIVSYFMSFAWFRKLRYLFGFKRLHNFPTHLISKTDEERCLTGDTKIDTDIGRIRLGSIVNKKLKVKVKSYNTEENKVEYKEILEYQRLKTKEDMLRISFPFKNNTNRLNTITCSLDHKFYTDGGYAEAQDLKVNNIIYNIDTVYGEEALPFIYGMVLGDTHLFLDNRLSKNNCINDSIRINFTQGEKQLDYLKFKQQLFGKDFFKIREGKSGYSDNKIYQANLHLDKSISETLKKVCVKDRKFHVTEEFAGRLTPISLAFWYMDDGCLRHKNSDKASPRINIYSCSLSKEENEILVSTLNNKFGIECNVVKEKSYWAIYISTKGTKKFLSLITKYMHPSMRYKTLKDLESELFIIKDLVFKKSEGLLATKIKEISLIKNYNKSIYDITVKDNHNFFANRVLTHNCQNFPTFSTVHKDKEVCLLEKLDGSSASYLLHREKGLFNFKSQFYVCSRNLNLHKDNNSIWWRIAKSHNIGQKLKQYYGNIAVQGEIIGTSVQDNKYKLDGLDFYIFNVIDIDKSRYFTLEEKLKFCEDFGFKHVPIVGRAIIRETMTVQDMLELAKGQSVINSTTSREGLVIRRLDDDRQSFKAINNDFLIKYNM